MKQKNLISKFIGELLKELESLSESEFKKLDSGDYTLTLKILKKNSAQESQRNVDTVDSNLILSELKSCTNRDDGYAVLHRHFKNKKELEWFAKQIDVYVMKIDKIDKIKEKIIEGTVGASLRSNAIKQNDA